MSHRTNAAVTTLRRELVASRAQATTAEGRIATAAATLSEARMLLRAANARPGAPAYLRDAEAALATTDAVLYGVQATGLLKDDGTDAWADEPTRPYGRDQVAG